MLRPSQTDGSGWPGWCQFETRPVPTAWQIPIAETIKKIYAAVHSAYIYIIIALLRLIPKMTSPSLRICQVRVVRFYVSLNLILVPPPLPLLALLPGMVVSKLPCFLEPLDSIPFWSVRLPLDLMLHVVDLVSPASSHCLELIPSRFYLISSPLPAALILTLDNAGMAATDDTTACLP